MWRLASNVCVWLGVFPGQPDGPDRDMHDAGPAPDPADGHRMCVADTGEVRRLPEHAS
jgi:hypothetical protein